MIGKSIIDWAASAAAAGRPGSGAVSAARKAVPKGGVPISRLSTAKARIGQASSRHRNIARYIHARDSVRDINRTPIMRHKVMTRPRSLLGTGRTTLPAPPHPAPAPPHPAKVNKKGFLTRHGGKIVVGGVGAAGVAAMVTRSGNATDDTGYRESRGMYMY